MEDTLKILTQISENSEKIYTLLNQDIKSINNHTNTQIEYYAKILSKQADLEDKIEELRKIVSKHSTKILALEFYKNKLNEN